MNTKFVEYKGLDLSLVNKDILKKWEENQAFERSISEREGKPEYVFFEGPPSANGVPGIHHVMARTIKDIFCRYKTQQGFLVRRKAGWDTHGLPVELGVEKALGITKEDIGKTISVEAYNEACRKDVMKYTDLWEELTHKMGYWVDMNDPYITYDNRYIESLWYLLKQLYNKGLLYKGYTIQPYSPAAGTGLSTHELNQPGCYRDVKDTTMTAQFKVVKNDKSDFLFDGAEGTLYFMAWTTTPWTLPSNTALCVGPDIEYVRVKSFNPYTGEPISVILANDLVPAYFNPAFADGDFDAYQPGDKKIPYAITGQYKGRDLEGISYEQLIPWVKPDGDAFRVICGDFVTTSDGTGIVHIAPTFGADDDRVAKAAGIVPLLLMDRDGKKQPMVDRSGKFFTLEALHPDYVKSFVNSAAYLEFAGRYVKNAFDDNLSEEDNSLDVDIAVMLKKENKAFRIEKHTHNYPHCWRTDKPVLYYPLDSWFIKTTAVRERMMDLNDTINWKPASTGTGRFGKWLENLQDWNLSRSRYWGTPLPIWRTEDGSEEVCIGSMEELIAKINQSVEAGFMTENPYEDFTVGDYSAENYAVEKVDLHRPFVDQIILVSPTGKPMTRELDLIDVWFDSGAMPYAQHHYPFSMVGAPSVSPQRVASADFIAEGVDQTRGWFFTLHAIATMCFDQVAFRNVISNGLVLDKNGNKMSKRLGNAVEPFEVIEKFGSDPLRWYMITNSQPWDNLKFDIAGVDEVKRKFFGTLYNTYSFFALYANIDGFSGREAQVPVSERPEIDRWIISLLNSLVKEVTESYESYEPTRAGRAIQDFVMENLSNWYVRLNRKRFWGGEMNADKLAAYQTLHQCLETVALLGAPIAPFFMERLFLDLNAVSGKYDVVSVHLAQFPGFDASMIDADLEQRMQFAQSLSSMVLALRRKVSIKVRQPLNKMMVPVLDATFESQLEAIKSLVLTEVNVKEMVFLKDSAGVLVKKIKPNFKALGPKYSKLMKGISAVIAQMDQQAIATFEQVGEYPIEVDGQKLVLVPEDVEILSEDIPGWLVANEGRLTVALDINVTDELREEGIAREFVNRIQNIRKDSGFDVTDKVNIEILKHEAINVAIEHYADYIGLQTLALSVKLVDQLDKSLAREVEIDENISTFMKIEKNS
ncbi:MAG: isoleucine--tRNA ligase [Breznakibacter sp.]